MLDMYNQIRTFKLIIKKKLSSFYAWLGLLFCSLLILQWNHHPPFIDHYKEGQDIKGEATDST